MPAAALTSRTISACEPHRVWIEAQVALGRNAVSIYQDLVEVFRASLTFRNLPTFEAFVDQVRNIHVAIMAPRRDKRPGQFEAPPNRAGDTRFVRGKPDC
jgi:hypothetical protein